MPHMLNKCVSFLSVRLSEIKFILTGKKQDCSSKKNFL